MAEPAPGVGHTDSMNSHDDPDKLADGKKKKSRRPAKLQIDYSTCNTAAPNATEFGNTADFNMDDDLITSAFKSDTKINAQWRHELVNHTYHGNYVVQNVSKCVINFILPDDMEPPVLFYYRLTNFYQNHRRYVSSYYDKQLLGDDVNTESSVSDSSCTPLTVDDNNVPYYPCGLIANSMFNDTFFSPVYQTNNNTPYELQNTSNIAWSSDNALYGNLPESQDLSLIKPPPNWQRQFPNNSYTTEAPPPDLKDNQAFQVWMRTAGLPTFSKLYARNDTATMKSGTYEIEILSGKFPVTEYQGTKSIVFTTKSVIGGKNPFLGIAYVVVGGICIVLGAIFTVTHLIRPRKLGDHTYLSWNKVSNNAAKPGSSGPSVGMSTGRDLA
ncbi:hypothetical protein E8E14_011254 [Neopestalotiopsis sp. 37M]|nr:hypothetical protein E8E14_011254 [Neopestalotiopsis sp. 37M]